MMTHKLISIMAVWDEQNMIALSIESTKDIVYEYVVLVKSGTDRTKEVVEWCRDKWNLNMKIVETDIKLRDARMLAVELTKEYADYYLIQDGDEIYFTDDELNRMGRETISDLMDQGYDHCEGSIIYLYDDLLHTKMGNSWLLPHPFLFKNIPEIFWPKVGDLPYVSFDWNKRTYRLYNSDKNYSDWDFSNGNHIGNLKEKRPFKFDCNIKNYSRLFKREVFTSWHDEENNISIEEYCYENDYRCKWYKENVNTDSSLDEIIRFYEYNDNKSYIIRYDENLYPYPDTIRKYIKLGLIKGINDVSDLNIEGVRLYYWKTENFGDILSKYIVKKISGRDIVNCFSEDFDSFKEPNLFSTGSIIQRANRNSIIWGSGTIDLGWSDKWDINKIMKDKIRCVRGPITASLLKDKIDVSIDKYGDPCLLVRDIYQSNVSKRYRLGIIPHLDDLLFIKKLNIESDDIKIISFNQQDEEDFSIEEKIDEVLECEYIISSSLHGIILPLVYGIPTMYFDRIKSSDGKNISDSNKEYFLTKYKDFFYSIYEYEYVPKVEVDWDRFSDKVIMSAFDSYRYPTLITNRINDLLNAYPYDNLSERKIYFINSVVNSNDDWHSFCFLNSKYRKNIIVTDYKKAMLMNFEKDDICILNCLPYSDMVPFFMNLKKNGKIGKLVLHSSGNIDFAPIERLKKFDLIFYETLYTYRMSYLNNHPKKLRAFGINTDIFKDLKIEKEFDYIWVGSINDDLKRFSAIKKLVSSYNNPRILMVGDIASEDDRIILEDMVKSGYQIDVRPKCNLRMLAHYYNISRCLLVTQPEYGGGERCMLEAKYCGLEIKIFENKKLQELNEEDIVFDTNYFTKQFDLGIDSIF